MPRVYTRAVVSTSDQAKRTESSRAVLRSYYCLCGDFLLVIQGKLDRLPRRKTDGAYIVRSQPGPKGQPARKFKLNAQQGTCVIVKRSEDKEVRQPFVCSRCRTAVAYQTTAGAAGSAPFFYILKGAMTEQQGRIPPDAFEGEDELPEAQASDK
ncbi:hypothetical protein VHUM_00708 [Vanrija humicola]|uniref:STEEP1 domain-containing protein n=1 Tax=Vanrija humicola TaxID=5417 RepID=A0A7D8V8L7_VANHU|nr:hypothetical protein VHUM_00708 [Vanrija humicola]